MIKAALLVADHARRRSGRGRPSTCRSIPARATPSSPTRRRPRRPSQISNLRPARNQGSVGGYRDIMLDQLFARHARRPARRAQPERESAVPQGRRRSRAVPGAADEGRSAAAGARLERRRDARPRRARHRAAARRRASASPRPSSPARSRRGWPATSASSTESPDRESASRADEYTRNFLAGRSAADDLAGARLPSPLPARRSRWPRSTRSPSDWFPEQNRLVVVSAPEAAGVVLPDRGAARRRGQDGDRRSGSTPTSTPAAGRR